MRKLIVCNIISLDGYYEGPGGDIMAMPSACRESPLQANESPLPANEFDIRSS